MNCCKMTRNILKILTIIQLCMFNQVFAQEIWRESFSVPEKGIWGSNDADYIKSDFEGILTWTLDYSNAFPVDSEDYAKTVSTSGGRFEVCDIDGEVIWRSEWIDISGFDKVDIELSASETGSGANTETKYLKAFYRLDDGEEIPFTENSENAGNWGSVQAVSKSLEGNALQIICYLSNHYAADKVILDEVVVAAEEKHYPPAEPDEIILNEILFNPFPGGEDYVEIYNNSEREIPIGKLFLASRDKNLQLEQIYDLSGKIYLIPPKSYVAITKDTSGVFPFFQIKCSECFQQVARIPSFNNDDDYVVLLNENLEILDELYYTEKMHTPFLADKEGVSLERVSFTQPTNSPVNWHSSSSDVGYGTPGYENSQTGRELTEKPKVIFEPEAFSPNHDGYNDEFVVRYEMAKPGYVANITIFDAAGRFVQHLAKNEILGTSGEFVWNGENETGSRQLLGVYVVIVEVFNAEGEIHRFKKGVVLTDVLD
ncbi:lamin tail domain-containing protein [Mariniphaga sp.]|uniref:lamin tail domain-containing protein n=1 Tax=Mariniphaga sp. TaxID=1954475 RepID=UPI0035648145